MPEKQNDKDLLRSVNSVNVDWVFRLAYFSKLLISKFLYRILSPVLDYRETLASISHLKSDLLAGNIERSGYRDHYSEPHELAVWYKYRNAFLKNSSSNSEVVFRASFVRDEVLRLIREDSDIMNCVDFGCSYGWLESEIMREAPRIRVWGLDRSPRAIELNKQEFNLPNLDFVATDVFDFIADHPHALKNSVFCHVNIGVYFLPTFLLKLYALVRDAGARYIVCFEPSGLSRQLHAYYAYSMEPKESVVFRGPMLIHNYPYLLKTSGFDVISAELASPPHPHKDFRSVRFTAKRSEL